MINVTANSTSCGNLVWLSLMLSSQSRCKELFLTLRTGLKKLSGNDAQQTEGWRPRTLFTLRPLIKLITFTFLLFTFTFHIETSNQTDHFYFFTFTFHIGTSNQTDHCNGMVGPCAISALPLLYCNPNLLHSLTCKRMLNQMYQGQLQKERALHSWGLGM